MNINNNRKCLFAPCRRTIHSDEFPTQSKLQIVLHRCPTHTEAESSLLIFKHNLLQYVKYIGKYFRTTLLRADEIPARFTRIQFCTQQNGRAAFSIFCKQNSGIPPNERWIENDRHRSRANRSVIGEHRNVEIGLFGVCVCVWCSSLHIKIYQNILLAVSGSQRRRHHRPKWQQWAFKLNYFMKLWNVRVAASDSTSAEMDIGHWCDFPLTEIIYVPKINNS